MIKKIRILGIAPYKGLATLMKQCALQYPEIEFTAYAGSMEQGLALAKRYSEHYDVIISRANTAKMISQSCISRSSILVLAIMMYCAVLKWPRIPGPNLPF